jgi:hypothetical protein
MVKAFVEISRRVPRFRINIPVLTSQEGRDVSFPLEEQQAHFPKCQTVLHCSPRPLPAGRLLRRECPQDFFHHI